MGKRTTKAKGKSYRVDYEQVEDGYWVAEIDHTQGVSCVTQGRSLSQARARIREALACYLEDEKAAAAAELVDNVRLPAALSKVVDKCKDARAEAERAAELALEVTEGAAKAMAKAGVSRRDTAEILGISFQRVHQLVEAPTAVATPNVDNSDYSEAARARWQKARSRA